MANQFEQMSLLPQEPLNDNSCFRCRFFAELKEPFVRSDEAVIYGYCFREGDKDYSPGMGKGYAVFMPDGRCKTFKAKKGAGPPGDWSQCNIQSSGDGPRSGPSSILCRGLGKKCQKNV